MNANRNRRAARRSSAGFTLIEMLLAMTITVMVMTAILTLFQLSARVARNQTQLADLQQNLRVALYDTQRYARMAGRGGLPSSLDPSTPFPAGKLLPAGAAIEIDNNVIAGTQIGNTVGPMVLAGTDTLTVRGVLFGSVYQSRISVPQFGANTISVDRLSAMGVDQDLSFLAEAVTDANNGNPEALIVVSPLGSSLYGIVELTGGTVDGDDTDGDTVPDSNFRGITLNFLTTGGTRQGSNYMELMPNGVFPPQMTSAAYVGVLEEYRYYVRDTNDPSDPNRSLVPRLARARFYPNSDDIHPSNPTAAEDIADNVLDLQITLGRDVNGNGVVEEGLTEAALAGDEWLFNDPDDVTDNPGAPGAWIWNAGPLELLRVTALVRTDQRDQGYVSPPIDRIEDRIYNEPDVPAEGAPLQARRYRRRQVESIIDFRNL